MSMIDAALFGLAAFNALIAIGHALNNDRGWMALQSFVAAFCIFAALVHA